MPGLSPLEDFGSLSHVPFAVSEHKRVLNCPPNRLSSGGEVSATASRKKRSQWPAGSTSLNPLSPPAFLRARGRVIRGKPLNRQFSVGLAEPRGELLPDLACVVDDDEAGAVRRLWCVTVQSVHIGNYRIIYTVNGTGVGASSLVRLWSLNRSISITRAAVSRSAAIVTT